MNQRRLLRNVLSQGALAAAAVSACVIACSSDADHTADYQNSEAALTPEECANLNVDRSLVIHDTQTLSAANFSLKRTLDQIVATSGGTIISAEALLKSLIEDFTITNAKNPESGLIMPVDKRGGPNQGQEGGLIPSELLDLTNANRMVPVALFNRLDLAPADGSHCGEHRIVYAKATGSRFFLIFEAVLPNPNPALGISGCKPVAEFWGSLSNSALTPQARALALSNFYYSGLPGFSPVVTHSHYGVPFGQIRSNHFVGPLWQLREWRTGFTPTGAATLVVDTTKQTPLAEYYDSTFTPIPGSGEFGQTQPGLFTSERSAFQQEFINNQIEILTAPELEGTATSAFNIINGIATAFPNRFHEFQSHAQSSSDTPLLKANTGFKSVIAAQPLAGLTADQVLNRVHTQTCGGCHQLSNGTSLGAVNGSPVTWPLSAGFVHVTEQGGLSQALTQFFLPARMQILSSFVCNGGGGSGGAGGTAGAAGTGGAAGDASGGTSSSGGSVNTGGTAGSAGSVSTGGTGGTGGYAGTPGTGGTAGSACGIKPRKPCCFTDSQCGDGRSCVAEACGVGREGVCKAPPPVGKCWQNSDCGRAGVCVGESICPCGTACFVADRPGTCENIFFSPIDTKSLAFKADSNLKLEALAPSSVEAAREAILNDALESKDASENIEHLELLVQSARKAERAQPGAFVKHRRTH